MNFASFIASRISFRSKRTFSKMIVRIAIVGIMLGLGVMILSVAIVKGFQDEVRKKIRGFAGDIQVSKLDLNASMENSPFAANDTFVNKCLANKSITHISAYATKSGIIKANNEIEGVVMKGVDKTYDWKFMQAMLEQGRIINFKDSIAAQKQIMVSQFTANRLKLKLGDDILMYFVQEPLLKRKLKIVGIFNIGVEEVDKTFVIGGLGLIKRLNGWHDNEIGGYEIRVNDFDNLTAINSNIGNIIPLELKSVTVTESYQTVFDWLKLLDVNTRIILVLMLAVAVINMISALLIMILERTSMIGMFKAMGATDWDIQQIFLTNAVYLLGFGLLLGNLFGIGLGIIQYKTHLFTLDQTSYYMSFVPIQLNWFDILMLNVGTLVICLAVLVIPSMLVSRISPVKAIRFK
ncbi:lipoprotein-releasing system permease protein [Mucilaginibacter gracilis]|uniref:Lipoprotein-releasing system permease protein n=1 Tax=Mucilaginibacter gracilis TaxID=423350 RepID=A0A495J0W8_9SPHI|nr:FtsX-like permease family protein [Mucilaginibacter gracilis]RKR82610.1 lipoprotein-releasing system permease protein [Mucilaginibacter gracilis]